MKIPDSQETKREWWGQTVQGEFGKPEETACVHRIWTIRNAFKNERKREGLRKRHEKKRER